MRFDLRKSNQAPIKPASHLTSPPIMTGSVAKSKSLVRLTGVSQLERSLVHKSPSNKPRASDESSDMSLPSPPKPPRAISKEKTEQVIFHLNADELVECCISSSYLRYAPGVIFR